jgi:hypothetical protein
MKKQENKEEKVFEDAWVYLDRKFVGLNCYEIIGFIENFKKAVLEEMDERS